MSRRGLVVALLCGLLGLGLGAVVAYAAQPAHPTGGTPQPMAAVSPSVPIDVHRRRSTTAATSPTPHCSPDLPLPPEPHDRQRPGHWTYHVPQGWGLLRSAPSACPPPVRPTTRSRREQVDRADEIRFRPPDEPTRRLQPAGPDPRQHPVRPSTRRSPPRSSGSATAAELRACFHSTPLGRCTSTTATSIRPPPLQLLPVVRGARADQRDPRDVGRRARGRRTGAEGAVQPVRRQRRRHGRAHQPPKGRTERRATVRARRGSAPSRGRAARSARSSLRTCTHSSVLALTWTARSMMTAPPGQPVEVTVSDGSPPGALCSGLPGVVQPGCCGSVGRAAGPPAGARRRRPGRDVCQSGRSPTDSADSLNVESRGQPARERHVPRPRARHGHRQDAVVVGERLRVVACRATTANPADRRRPPAAPAPGPRPATGGASLRRRPAPGGRRRRRRSDGLLPGWVSSASSGSQRVGEGADAGVAERLAQGGHEGRYVGPPLVAVGREPASYDVLGGLRERSLGRRQRRRRARGRRRRTASRGRTAGGR